MNDSLYSAQVRYIEAQSKQFKGELTSGVDAFKADDKPRRINVGDSIFKKGDVFTLPNLPETSEADAKRWIAAPLSKNGDPILRCLVECKGDDGVESVKQLFAGTLTKSVRNRDTGVTVMTSGTAADAIADCVTNQDIWKKLAGKTLVVKDITTVPIIRRGFNGQADRPGDAQVLTIDLV